MNEIISYILIGTCSILVAIVSYDLIKLFIKKRRHETNDETEEVSE